MKSLPSFAATIDSARAAPRLVSNYQAVSRHEACLGPQTEHSICVHARRLGFSAEICLYIWQESQKSEHAMGEP
jgi:hypothetical protein